MNLNNNYDIAKPHTIKKFELIEKYTKEWVYKLLNNSKCCEIVFVDCMCNSGIYNDELGNEVYGTPIRVAKIISEAMEKYPNKKAKIYYNDFSKEKIEILKTKIPNNTSNFIIEVSVGDGNQLLTELSSILSDTTVNYLIVYDPFQANIDWEAINPFLLGWGEVIVNHMISDTIRAIRTVKRENAVKKYEKTYLSSIEQLISMKGDKNAFETKIEEIIAQFKSNKSNNYLSIIPFFNTKNALVYNLVFSTNSIVGLKTFKKNAWKTFGGKSSIKNKRNDGQMMFDWNNNSLKRKTDGSCYDIEDVAEYIVRQYKDEKRVPLETIWRKLDEHPIFPSDGFKTEIKNVLKEKYGCKIEKNSIIMNEE